MSERGPEKQSGRPSRQPVDPEMVKKQAAIVTNKGTTVKRIVGIDGRTYISRRLQ